MEAQVQVICGGIFYICNAGRVIQEGVAWKVGNGLNIIKICKDGWLGTNSPSKLTSHFKVY